MIRQIHGQAGGRIAYGSRLQKLLGTMSPTADLACLFGSFAFLQFTALGLANHAGEGYLSTPLREQVYYALQVFVILGYLLYGLFCRIREGKRVRKTIACGVCGVFFFSVTVMLFAGTASLLNVIASMLAALTLGGLGGAAHHRISMAGASGAKVAWSMGVGSSAAIVLQYLLQIHWGVTPVLPAFLGVAFLLFLFMLRSVSPEAAETEQQYTKTVSTRRVVSAVLIAATFILFACFYNETIHHLMIQSEYSSANVYSWPRLMLVPIYLLYAVIGDRGNGKYVPIASLCIMLIALLNVVLVGNAGAYWLNMCFFYCAIAAYTCYYLLTFWRLAPGTRHPALWAPFGRMLDSAMVLFTGAIHLSELSAPVVMGMDIAGIVMVLLLMTMDGSFNLLVPDSALSRNKPESDSGKPPAGSGSDQPAAMSLSTTQEDAPPAQGREVKMDPAPMLSPEEGLQRMQEQYGLTLRETEMLRELVTTEDKQTVICERMSIQARTLQYYVTHLYRKTGATTRAGLTELYHTSRQRN